MLAAGTGNGPQAARTQAVRGGLRFDSPHIDLAVGCTPDLRGIFAEARLRASYAGP